MTSSPKNLRRHKRLHEGSQYRCHICGKMFGEAGNMKRHILHVHNSQHVPKRMCPHCNKEFTTKNNLIQKQLIEHAAIVHPGVPILSTKMDDDVTLANQVEATAMSTANLSSDQGRQQTLSTLEEVEGAAGPSTIILQTTDGSGHMIVTHQGLEDQNSSVSQLQQHMVDMKAAGSLHSAVNSIDMLDSGTPAEPTTTDASLSLVSQQPLTSTSVTEPGLSLVAQQALAAFEAGELDTSEFGPDHYLTVIGEDGQEIRVQILRKDTDGHQRTELMNMYTQESNVTLALSEHVQEESTSQHHNVAAAAGHQSRETTTVEGARGVVSEQEEANRVFIEGVQYVNNDLNQFMDPPTNDKHHEKSMETDNS
ncbi:hypothetical protein EB796_023498 [Bugula neritina]|uniref:C2H2-type domain-containing protein n=1 Tax=Bugula neritina TaxID=10212 RepID=A0A7J7IWM2_BUGNE|nr:hypothetical protein EB796_023498 [Bugula neritina]